MMTVGDQRRLNPNRHFRTGQLSLKKLGHAKSGKWANFQRRGVSARKLAHSISPWANFISKLAFHAVWKKYVILYLPVDLILILILILQS